jgi:hypothetical protein
MGPLTYKVFNLHHSKQCETYSLTLVTTSGSFSSIIFSIILSMEVTKQYLFAITLEYLACT